MKNIFKVVLLIISLTLVLSCVTLSAFAAQKADDTNVESKEEFEEKEVERVYTNEKDEIIFVFEDGREYNSTLNEWKEVEKDKGIDLKINFDNMISSLQYMWKGMLCIFVVIGVIIISVYTMNFISRRAEELKQAKEEENE